MKQQTIATYALVLGMLLTLLHAEQGCCEEPRSAKPPMIRVATCDDFRLSGKGDAAPWRKAEWVTLNRRPGGKLKYQSRFKMLYSTTGIYVLFDGSDRKLTATMTNDFDDLWNEDVFECFFWTDEKHPVYFEYEISPLGYELPILVPNLDGKFLGWRPWHYEGERKTRKAVTVAGGKKRSMSEIESWRAEVFIPYALLKPLRNVPPEKGTKWRANFYRVDHDNGNVTGWDWARVGNRFHEYKKFGTVLFD